MKYVVMGIVVIIASAIIIAVIMPGALTSPGGHVVRANVNRDCSSAPWFIGMQKGYFKANGIDLVDKGPLGWSLQPAALISGQIDVYDGRPDTVINLLLSGAKVRAVALSGIDPGPVNTSKGDLHWLVLDASPYSTVNDLVAGGHKPKVGVSTPGFCMQLDSTGWYADHNITMGSLEFVLIPDPQLEDALRQGQIDIAVLPPSFYTIVEPRGGLRVISTSLDPQGGLSETSLLVFTEKFIKEHPDAVRAFIKAYKDAERWSNDHRKEAGELTAKTIGLSSATAHYYSYTGKITDADIQPWIDAMVTDGVIKEGQFKPSDLYTTEFSDLWVNESAPQPLNPFGESTKFNSSWVNQTIQSINPLVPLALSADSNGPVDRDLWSVRAAPTVSAPVRLRW